MQKVKEWEIEALYAGLPMNRKVRRAAIKKERVFLKKTLRYAREGSKRAQGMLEEWAAINDTD